MLPATGATSSPRVTRGGTAATGTGMSNSLAAPLALVVTTESTSSEAEPPSTGRACRAQPARSQSDAEDGRSDDDSAVVLATGLLSASSPRSWASRGVRCPKTDSIDARMVELLDDAPDLTAAQRLRIPRAEGHPRELPARHDDRVHRDARVACRGAARERPDDESGRERDLRVPSTTTHKS